MPRPCSAFPPAAVALAIAAGIVISSTPAQAIDDGFYFSFGLGYAHVLGERGVELDARGGCADAALGHPFLWSETSPPCVYVPGPADKLLSPDYGDYVDARYREIVRTDTGSGLALQLRFGYTILGYASVELSLAGNGAPTFSDGIVYADFQALHHPVEHFIHHDDRDWDANVFLGVGYAIAGYKPRYSAARHAGTGNEPNHKAAFDGKGWEGWDLAFGAEFSYAVTSLISVGLDFRVIAPFWSLWIANRAEQYQTTPASTPSTFVIAPTAQVKFHL